MVGACAARCGRSRSAWSAKGRASPPGCTMVALHVYFPIDTSSRSVASPLVAVLLSNLRVCFMDALQIVACVLIVHTGTASYKHKQVASIAGQNLYRLPHTHGRQCCWCCPASFSWAGTRLAQRAAAQLHS